MIQTEGTSFTAAIQERSHHTVVSIQGLPQTAKTTLALSAPSPIAYMDFDMNGDVVLSRISREKEIVEAKYRLDMPPVSLSGKRADYEAQAAQVIDSFRRLADQFRCDFHAVLKRGVRTVVWDTATEVWEVIRLAHFGRLEKVPSQLYVAPNSEYRSMVREAKAAKVNLILVHREKEVWEDRPYLLATGEGKSNRAPAVDPVTKEPVMTLAGMGELGYLVEMAVRTRFVQPRRDRTKADRPMLEPGHFFVDILKCTDNAGLCGETFESTMGSPMGFAELMGMAYPEHDWSE